MTWKRALPTQYVLGINLCAAFIVLLFIALGGHQLQPMPSHNLAVHVTAERSKLVLHATLAAHKTTKKSVLHQPKLQAPPPIQSDYTLPPIENGLAPLIYRIATSKPVVFLTIDDGAYKDPSVIQALAQNHIQATLFLAKLFIGDNPQFFKQITAQGSMIEDHTLSHDTAMTSDMTLDQQKAEICGMADYEQQQYGLRPLLFRPPGGAFSDSLRRAAADCGMRAVVTWSATVNNGSVQYQVGTSLHPGDIVLMHFRPTFTEDLAAFVAAKNAAGLQTELLENWIL